MCLIIQGKPKHFTKEIIKKAFNQNPHGFGLMYLCKDTNRVITKKFFTKKINKIQKVCKEHFKKADEKSIDQIMVQYQKIIKQQNGTRKVTPPGMFADYGYFLIQRGDLKRGKENLKKEILLYPESKIFIDRILKLIEE